MKINSTLVKKLRTAKNWSQEQLGELCGLSLRTIQRLENGGNTSIESVRALAAVFEVDPSELTLSEEEAPQTPLDAVQTGLSEFANFSGTATRFEYWWFFLFFLLLTTAAAIIHEKASQFVALLLLLPFLAVGARRLNDIGRSGWWQLFFFVPFGQIVVLILMAQPDSGRANQPVNKSLDTA
ncbi:MAG: DUF805 domain-containing protein [Anaerolineae bacterium]|nr:DUF805 domain-containing protein [Anaerolineae bacterium]